MKTTVCSRVPERERTVKCIRWLAQHLPLLMLPTVLFVWKKVRIWQKQWGKDWRALVQDIIHWDNGPRKRLLLTLLPSSSPDHACWKYRTPLWWALAIHGNTEMLDWAQQGNHIHIEEPHSEVSFLYLAIISSNEQAMLWGLKNGMDPNGLGPDRSPLICCALKRANPSQPQLISQLLLHGASWYHSGPSGESAASYSQTEPRWQQWFLNNCISDGSRPRRKTRIM